MKKLIIRFLLKFIKKELDAYVKQRIADIKLYTKLIRDYELSDEFIIKIITEINKRQLK